MMNSNMGAIAAVPFMKLDETGNAFLFGSKCQKCGEIMLGDCRICLSCGARNQLEEVRLGGKGKLYSYTIVYRSFPGTQTPFIAAIVDLDGGGTVMGTLVDIEPAPPAIAYDMPVKIEFRDTGQKDPEGHPFISYYFVPAGRAEK